jgi:ankyrin repeat protein
MWFAHMNSDTMTEFLIENGADVDLKNEKGWSALSLACREGSAKTVKVLIDHGADLESRTPEGCTPLMSAAQRGSEPVIRLLVEAGANVHAKDNKGETAVTLARQNLQSRTAAVVALLEDYGREADKQRRYKQ